jgi:hypothetical protein
MAIFFPRPGHYLFYAFVTGGRAMSFSKSAIILWKKLKRFSNQAKFCSGSENIGPLYRRALKLSGSANLGARRLSPERIGAAN